MIENNSITLLFFSYLYQIAHLGDDDDEPEFSSAMPLEEGDTFFFAPRPLRNLVLVDEMDSLSPIMACQVIYLYSYNMQILVQHFQVGERCHSCVFFL